MRKSAKIETKGKTIKTLEKLGKMWYNKGQIREICPWNWNKISIS